MRVVVVGATGNVGTAVLRRLAAVRLAGDGRAGSDEGLQVVGVARRLPDARVAPYDVGVWHAVDVGGDGAVEELAAVFRGADAVVHLAWALQPTHDIPAQHRTNVRGTANVLAAVASAGVQQVVVASSVGAYRGVDVDGKRTAVDETFPATGIPTATYSVHKAENERALDTFEREHPDVVVTRLRPGLVFQRAVAAELRGLFLGHLVPMSIVRAARFAVLPLPLPFVFQAVHADDLADAFWRAIDRRATGAFNIAASPVLTPPRMARAAGMLGAVRCGADPAPPAARDRHADLAAPPPADGRRVARHRSRRADHADRPGPDRARVGAAAHRGGRPAGTRGRLRRRRPCARVRTPARVSPA